MFLLYGLAILISDLHFVAYGHLRPGSDVSKKGTFDCSEIPESFVGVRRLSDHLGRGRVHMIQLQKIDRIKKILADFLYGRNASDENKFRRQQGNCVLLFDWPPSRPFFDLRSNYQDSDNTDPPQNKTEPPDMYASGRLMHAELFLNKTGVHLPLADLMQTGKCRLSVTQDFMQTAVDAFAVILEGSLDDVLALPSDYVLRSARTISMMKIPLEKMSKMWEVVLNGSQPETISYETLEMYRPLFKYLNGKQMARLDLSNPKIVSYIGTHPDLNRRQVGVVAKKYIKTNPQWDQSKHLSTMNNLLCGVPMSFMRKLDEAVYLRLEHQTDHRCLWPKPKEGHKYAIWGFTNYRPRYTGISNLQVFYHIRACDPLQRRFYLNMMTRTQALGKAFSWSARDVSRLGLLMAEVEGPALAGIRPEAMAGITAHVMAEIKPENMQYITEIQIEYINLQAKKILAKKLKRYALEMKDDRACRPARSSFILLLIVLICPRILIKQ